MTENESDSEEEIMEVNDETDDDSISDEEEEKIKRAENLEGQLSSNKYLYDVHLELVELYRKLGDLTLMRDAYARFQECFPLTAKLWLAWINDEIKLRPAEEKQHVFNLFDKAVDDYLSVDLWQKYAEYQMQVGNLESTRIIIDRGLLSAGLHVKDGSLLWDFARELELAQLGAHPEGTDEWKERASRVAEIFKRQLSVPLIDMENTYLEWQEWLKSLPENHGIDDKQLEWGYHKAIKTLEVYKPFEEKLLSANDDEELLNIYKEYLKSVDDPSTIICLYERMITVLCLHPNVWMDYCSYMFKLGEPAVKVINRALRNCPWSEELWIMKLRVLENQASDEKDILATFEQGITSITPSPGLDLWLSYMEYTRRTSEGVNQLEDVFKQAITHISADIDVSSKIQRFYSRICAQRGEIKKSRNVWNKVMANPQNKVTTSLWLEYVTLEKHYGDANHVRTIFQKALAACKEWPQYIAEEWIMYERECGSLIDVLKCLEKCGPTSSIQVKSQMTESQQQNPVQKGKKRRFDVETHVEIKRVKKEVKKLIIEPKKMPIVRDPTKTAFVSNIHPGVDETKLKTVFPNSINIEVVLDRKGKSRCYAYVQFSLEEELMHALARDREPLDGRPIFISNCKPDKKERKAVFKYSAQVEENKLFIRGLPKAKTKEEIEDIYKPYGVVDVRLVLHKSGQPKGLAYVEFTDGAAAKKAMSATDQMNIDDHIITVAISAPPPKNTGGIDVAGPTRHARSRLQMPMIPRSLQVKSDKNTTSTSNGGNSEKLSKSNDDFRKMLLNK